MIADVCYTGPHHTPPDEYPKSCRIVDEANARLIAAAPEMLEVLERISGHQGQNGEDNPQSIATDMLAKIFPTNQIKTPTHPAQPVASSDSCRWVRTSDKLPGQAGEQSDILMWSSGWATWLKGMVTRWENGECEWAIYNQQDDYYLEWKSAPEFWMAPILPNKNSQATPECYNCGRTTRGTPFCWICNNCGQRRSRHNSYVPQSEAE